MIDEDEARVSEMISAVTPAQEKIISESTRSVLGRYVDVIQQKTKGLSAPSLLLVFSVPRIEMPRVSIPRVKFPTVRVIEVPVVRTPTPSGFGVSTPLVFPPVPPSFLVRSFEGLDHDEQVSVFSQIIAVYFGSIGADAFSEALEQHGWVQSSG